MIRAYKGAICTKFFYWPSSSMDWDHSAICLKVSCECWPTPRKSQVVWKIGSRPEPVCGWWSACLKFWQQLSLNFFLDLFEGSGEDTARRVESRRWHRANGAKQPGFGDAYTYVTPKLAQCMRLLTLLHMLNAHQRGGLEDFGVWLNSLLDFLNQVQSH